MPRVHEGRVSVLSEVRRVRGITLFGHVSGPDAGRRRRPTRPDARCGPTPDAGRRPTTARETGGRPLISQTRRPCHSKINSSTTARRLRLHGSAVLDGPGTDVVQL
eukprot:3027896-Prymnesium_polylepis.2